jgi:hypothetical protein
MPLHSKDRCPCGSGERYKHCHKRFEERERELRDMILEFARSPEIDEEVGQAKEEWFGHAGRVEADESEFNLFIAYSIFTRRLAGQDTLLDRFLARRGGSLHESDKALLTNFGRGRWGIYETIEVRKGSRVTFRDILTNERFEVRDVSISESLKRWILLFTRLYPARGAWLTDGGGLPFLPEGREEILEVLDRLTPGSKQLPVHEQVGMVAPSVFRAIKAIVARPPWKEAITLEGDPVVPCGATYAVRETKTLVAALKKADDIYPAGPDDAGTGLVFNLAVPQGRIKDEGVERVNAGRHAVIVGTNLIGPGMPPGHPLFGAPNALVNLATITVGGDSVEVDAISRPRLEKAIGLLRRCGLDGKETKSWEKPVDLQTMLAVQRSRSGDEGDEAREVSPRLEQVAKLFSRKIADEFLENWPKESIPALGGLTPLEAAKNAGRRDDLVALLKDMEIKAENRGSPLQKQDVWALARKLGLDKDLNVPGSGAGISEESGRSRRRRRGR